MYFNIEEFPGNAAQEIEIEEFEMKEETVSIKEKGSTVEDACTVYVQGESMKMESTELKSKKYIVCIILYLCYLVVSFDKKV